ncbi:hypothetical protein BDB01DRAFT_834788 [Pilobolus umbonatus]|nr:hypothetical protein BDB01DRAFT_834788 [Pilobolus umbonatus]
MPATASDSLSVRALALVKTLQFVWFSGHILTLLGSILYLLTVLLFRSNTLLYKVAYLGAILSYGVVIYKTHGYPQANPNYARKLLMDENAQYLLLAVFWFFSSPITVTLIPFFTFSSFHALGYIRTNIINTLFPRPANSGASWQAKTQQQIKSWTDKYYSVAMRLVAQSEVTIISVRLFFGLFRFQILPIFFFAQFLRFRYHLSAYIRQTFADLRIKCDTLLLPPTADPRIPEIVPKVYTIAKGMIIKFADSIVQPQPGPQ